MPFGENKCSTVHMSRFYNALKEASRLKPSGEGLSLPEVAEVDTPAATRTETPANFLLEDVLEPPAPVVNNGFFGRHADVTFDRTARLIPHAVDPTLVEHYRRLRTKIMQQQTTKPFRSLVVTSPNPREGKSVTVMNL